MIVQPEVLMLAKEYVSEEYEENTGPWAAILGVKLVSDCESRTVTGSFPPNEGLPGAPTAEEAKKRAFENLQSKVDRIVTPGEIILSTQFKYGPDKPKIGQQYF